jgi:hypothetical protein
MVIYMRQLFLLILFFLSISFPLMSAEKNEYYEKFKAKLYEEVGYTEEKLKAMDDVTATEDELKIQIAAKVKSALATRFSDENLAKIEASAASKYKFYKKGDKFTGVSAGRPVTGTVHEVRKLQVRVGDYVCLRKDYPTFYFDPRENAKLRKAHIQNLFHSKKGAYERKANDHYTDKLMTEAGYIKIRGIWRSPQEIIANIEKRAQDWLKK